MLFTHEDVGKVKVEVARDKIERDHKINKEMKVEAYNMCALKNW
jgi:molybdopterin/thiamine biosynthesis adenylyltransferase